MTHTIAEPSVSLFQAQSRRAAHELIHRAFFDVQQLDELCDEAWAYDPAVQATPAGTPARQEAIQKFLAGRNPRLAELFPARVSGLRQSLGLAGGIPS